MKATILTIGDEILIGQIVDTNSVSIAKHLNAAGIVVREKISIGDDRAQITGAVERALRMSEVTIVTGGLGPTKDDITKKTLAELFRSDMRYDERVAAHVERMLAERGIDFNELNRSQAMVPACCTVLFNAYGTAPGMWFERDGHVVVSLPGVPFEMEHLMQDEVMPRLKARFALRQIVHRTMITAGLPESMLAERIAAWESALPPYLKLAYLPNPGAVRLRLSAYEVEGDAAAREIERQFEALRRIIPRNVIGHDAGARPRDPHPARPHPRHGRKLHGRDDRLAVHGHARRIGLLPLRRGVVQQRSEDETAGRRSRCHRPPRSRQRGGRPPDGRRSPPHGVGRLCRGHHGHRGPRGRLGRKARRPGLDRRGLALRNRCGPQAVRLRPGTDHRPRLGLRHRAAARLPERQLAAERSGRPRGKAPPGGRPPRPARKKRRPLLLFAEKVVYLHSLNRVLTKNNQTMKVCEITGKVAIVGNNVSHSHHKTKRKFSPNLKTKRFWSEQEGRWITLKVSAAGMKTINKKGLAVALREAAAPKSVY